MHPIHKIIKFHAGMDFTAPIGTEIHATGDGKVIFADYGANGYGLHVIIDHGFDYQTLYAHMDELKVRVGQLVKRRRRDRQRGEHGIERGAARALRGP
jgi:murein DD-endopeptidase MepM/ murein hydrolase activator NlpD